jgi:hypothetical protein
MKTLLVFIICIFAQIHSKRKENTHYYVIKNNNSCFDCFKDIKEIFNQKKMKNYSVLISYSNDIIINIENKEKLSNIFDFQSIDFTTDETYKVIKTPAILVVRKIKGKQDSLFLNYDELFKNKTINSSLIK